MTGAYTTDRAAGLSGVPLSTLHYWSREGIWTPSVSSTKVKLWSFSDLLGLRLIDWLRQDKEDIRLPRSSMSKIRRALSSTEAFGERFAERTLDVLVDAKGGIVLGGSAGLFIPLKGGGLQGLIDSRVDLIDSYQSRYGLKAPNLSTPRPTLRIVPGKLSGEPHVAETRTETRVIAALRSRGFDASKVRELYPVLTEENIDEALDLEEQLARALRPVAA